MYLILTIQHLNKRLLIRKFAAHLVTGLVTLANQPNVTYKTFLMNLTTRKDGMNG